MRYFTKKLKLLINVYKIIVTHLLIKCKTRNVAADTEIVITRKIKGD